MSKLNRIQAEIKQIEGGKFQKLCDIYLYRKLNWENIVSLGSMDGTDKTTKGIPDTYFFDSLSNRYILVMYGTRKDATAKLEMDIKEAIEKTKIDERDIQEIICCHTSSNLTVEKDKDLRTLAGGIELTLIGIDTLSHDFLEFKYQDIAKEFLGIAESTEQVWSIQQFISIHDRSKTNAPLNTSYIDEKNRVKKLTKELIDNQILLLSGVPGTGKTRLAIELCKKLPTKSNIICVKSNSMPVYQDIKDALDSNKMNYLFLDDANTITNFDAVVNLLVLEEYEKKLTIIITVRDYALSGIINQLNSFKTKIEKISLMGDEEVELLINSVNKVSPSKLRKIAKLSRNNPRIAVVAAIMAKEPSYKFIDDGKGVLDSYYEQIIRENDLSQIEKNCLFILSFKHKLNLTNQEPLKELLNFFKLDFDTFCVLLKQLHDKELCDIFQDKAVKISDQSLSDFLIVDFIANNKSFKVRDFFIKLFSKSSLDIVETLQLVNNFKNSNEWRDYLTTEIKYVYNEVISDSDKELFLTQYAVLIPIETLAYINERILSASSNEYKISQTKFKEKIKSNQINDPIIEIICSLSNSEKFNDAGILLMKYLKKKQDKVYEIFLAIRLNFNIELDCSNYLEKRLCIFEIFSEQKDINELTALLIANIAEEFLDFSGEKSTFTDKNFVIRHYKLIDGDYLIKLHTKIFDVLYKVYQFGYAEVNNHIEELLFTYPVYEVKNGFLNTVSSDLKYIETLFFNDLSNLDIRQEAIVFRMHSEANKVELKNKIFIGYQPSSKQDIYRIFSENRLTYGADTFNHEKNEAIRINNLKEIFEKTSDNLPWLFSVLSEYQTDSLLNNHVLPESINLLYSSIDREDKMKMLTALLSSEFDLSSYYYDYYIENLSFEETKYVLNNIGKVVDEKWFLSNLLARTDISSEMLEELISLLNNIKHYEKINSFSIISFESYIKKDATILDILWSKYGEGTMLDQFFIPYYATNDEANRIINIVGYKKLKGVYLNSLGNENIDKSGEIFKMLLKEHNDDFIYSFFLRLGELSTYLNFIELDTQLKYVWESKVAENAIREYFNFLIKENRVIYVGVNEYLEKILKANMERALIFIRTEILSTEDKNRLLNLYKLSLEIFDDEVLVNLFKLLKDKNITDVFFKKLNLTVRTHSWSGSLVPFLDKEIVFLSKILNIFEGIEYISLALVITKCIDSIKKQKEYELLEDYLE